MTDPALTPDVLELGDPGYLTAVTAHFGTATDNARTDAGKAIAPVLEALTASLATTTRLLADLEARQ